MGHDKKFGLALMLFVWIFVSTAKLSNAAQVVIGYSTINPRVAPLWIAQEMGYFQKYGLEATLIFLRSTPVLIAGMKSGGIPVAYGVGGSILNASVSESDLKILATFTGRMTNNLVARPGIKTAKELRKKTVGVQSIGGTNWIGAMLWLENLGLDPQRDNITILPTGDQTIRAQALESGNIDAAAVDLVFSKKLEQRGFIVLGDSQRTNIPFVGVDLAATRMFLSEQSGSVENVIKALLESFAYIISPKNHGTVLALIMRRLRIADPALAEEGYQELLRTMSRKPYPALEGLRNIQRFTKAQNPQIGKIKVEELIDSRFIRKLDDSGFIDGLYGPTTR
jgi:ABC-type nitrate/sulfonate/bicarbonate transport system substrate-binding protein